MRNELPAGRKYFRDQTKLVLSRSLRTGSFPSLRWSELFGRTVT